MNIDTLKVLSESKNCCQEKKIINEITMHLRKLYDGFCNFNEKTIINIIHSDNNIETLTYAELKDKILILIAVPFARVQILNTPILGCVTFTNNNRQTLMDSWTFCKYKLVNKSDYIF